MSVQRFISDTVKLAEIEKINHLFCMFSEGGAGGIFFRLDNATPESLAKLTMTLSTAMKQNAVMQDMFEQALILSKK